ncbi:MAG: hypothetical protein PHW34_13380 [Hespellia sp.]|nr:hypothetical protein [Hespellia sp.]
MKTVDILGTKYKIVCDVDEEQLPEGADGSMDQSIHEIRIVRMERDRNSIENLESYKKKVLRHEIIHAFLYESGLWNNSCDVEGWGQSEEITDWIAIQSPKIFNAFKEARCL